MDRFIKNVRHAGTTILLSEETSLDSIGIKYEFFSRISLFPIGVCFHTDIFGSALREMKKNH